MSTDKKTKKAPQNSQRVGKAIAMFRLAKNMSQIDLAKKCGLTTTAVSNYENGYSAPNIENLYKLADSLDVLPADLVPADDQMQNIILFNTYADAAVRLNVETEILERVIGMSSSVLDRSVLLDAIIVHFPNLPEPANAGNISLKRWLDAFTYNTGETPDEKILTNVDYLYLSTAVSKLHRDIGSICDAMNRQLVTLDELEDRLEKLSSDTHASSTNDTNDRPSDKDAYQKV